MEHLNIQEKLSLYTEAKETYYNTGQSILSDYDFDVLESQLLSAGLINPEVGASVPGNKVKHLTPMLSLAKVQVFSEDFQNIHFMELEKLLSRQTTKFKYNKVLGMFKLDGCSVSLVYKAGTLTNMITRGNGKEGISIFNKFRIKVPSVLSVPFTGEIRGEAVMRNAIFEAKYSSDYKNPRNLVSGILNDENLNDTRKLDVDFIMFDVRGHNEETKEQINKLSDIKSDELNRRFASACSPKLIDLLFFDLVTSYDTFKSMRDICWYPTDGIVYKLHMPDFDYNRIQHNGHDPYHVVAVKFPPKETITIINKIDWQLNKTGRYTPIGILEPVDLDGSTVTRVSLHNLDNVLQKRLYPGCKIAIAKNGDIIPAVQKVIEWPTAYTEQMLWESLPAGTRKDGAYLVDDGSQETLVQRTKFIHTLYMLEMDDFGGAAFSKLFDFTKGDWTKLFDPGYTNFGTLFTVFSGERTREKFMGRINTRKKMGIHTSTLIMMQGINQLGPKTAYQIALSINNQPYTFKGLDKAVLQAWQDDPEYVRVTTVLSDLNVPIIHAVAEVEDENQITFEMTGDVNVPGLKTKDDFKRMIPDWKHTSLKKGTTYLITNDLASVTNKMKSAAKLGIEVMTYEQALEKYKN